MVRTWKHTCRLRSTSLACQQLLLPTKLMGKLIRKTFSLITMSMIQSMVLSSCDQFILMQKIEINQTFFQDIYSRHSPLHLWLHGKFDQALEWQSIVSINKYCL